VNTLFEKQGIVKLETVNGQVWSIGDEGVINMVITMEKGQSAEVPWVKIYLEGKRVLLVNCSSIVWLEMMHDFDL